MGVGASRGAILTDCQESVEPIGRDAVDVWAVDSAGVGCAVEIGCSDQPEVKDLCGPRSDMWEDPLVFGGVQIDRVLEGSGICYDRVFRGILRCGGDPRDRDRADDPNDHHDDNELDERECAMGQAGMEMAFWHTSSSA